GALHDHSVEAARVLAMRPEEAAVVQADGSAGDDERGVPRLEDRRPARVRAAPGFAAVVAVSEDADARFDGQGPEAARVERAADGGPDRGADARGEGRLYSAGVDDRRQDRSPV